MNLPRELIYIVAEKYQFKLDKEHIEWAIDKGYTDVLRHAIKRGIKVVTIYNFIRAIKTGKFEIIDLFYPEIDDFATGGLYSAAGYGSLEVVKYLHQKFQTCEDCTEWAMDIAAENGHLHIVEWLHRNCRGGCSTRAMDWAAAKGQLHILNWLHVNRNEGCSEWAEELAIKFDKPESIVWLRNHGYIN